MNIGMESKVEWCVIRHRDGIGFDVVRSGYKTQENAQRSIPGISRRLYDETRDATAKYAVGYVRVSAPTAVTSFYQYKYNRCCA